MLRAFYDVMMAPFVPVNATPKHQDAKGDQDCETRICADLPRIHSLGADVLSGPRISNYTDAAKTLYMATQANLDQPFQT